MSLPEVSSVGCSPRCSFFLVLQQQPSPTPSQGAGVLGPAQRGQAPPGLAAASSSSTGDTRPPSAGAGTSTGTGLGPASAPASAPAAPARELGLSAAWFAQELSSWGRCWIVLVEFKKKSRLYFKTSRTASWFFFLFLQNPVRAVFMSVEMAGNSSILKPFLKASSLIIWKIFSKVRKDAWKKCPLPAQGAAAAAAAAFQPNS